MTSVRGTLGSDGVVTVRRSPPGSRGFASRTYSGPTEWGSCGEGLGGAERGRRQET